MKYLANRGIEIIKRAKPLEITENEEMLANVAGCWSANADEIRCVVQARCDKLREKLIATDMPYETPVTRNALLEIAGILEDFERIETEFKARDKDKPDDADKDKPEEGT